MKELADNCQACGMECAATDLTPIKLGGIVFDNLKICPNCLIYTDPQEELKVAAKIIASTFENE